MSRRMTCPRCSVRHSPWCAGPTWPLAPLLDVIGNRPAPLTFRCSGDELARAEANGLTDTMADRWATRAGFHPVQVWGWEWITAGLSVVDARFVASGWRTAWLYDENEPNTSQEAAA